MTFENGSVVLVGTCDVCSKLMSSSPIKQGATKLNPRNSSWALALGGTHGESKKHAINLKSHYKENYSNLNL